MVANILPTDTPLTQGVGSKGQTIYFSESSHVAYQIKADDAGSNMQHAHSYFCLGVHVPPGVSIWRYMIIFEGTHILELFFHS